MSKTKHPKILVIADRGELVSGLRGRLAEEGFGVVEVPHAKAGLEKLVTMDELPSLILLDPDGPGMSGSEMLKVLRSYMRLAAIPVLLLSAGTDRNDGSPNVEGHVRQPISQEDVLARVREHARDLAFRPRALDSDED